MSGNRTQAIRENGALLQATLSEVIQGAKLTAKRRGASIKPTVEALTSQCYDNGILPDALAELVDLVTTPSHLDQASLNDIIRNLYPTTPVNSDIVVRVVGCLGYGALKPSLAIQTALLKWLIMIHHIIEKQDVLMKSYSVLFNLLDTAATRPRLCHLLALITRRRHVRPYRIQAVLSLSRQTGNDPALTGLLRVFKDYYPEIIAGEATRGKASAFKHPDLQWRERLNEVQRAHAQTLSEVDQPRDAFRVARLHVNPVSRSRANAVPEVHTSHAQENSVTLEEIENVDGLVKGLETIELPNQLISVLADPLLQKLMLLRPDVDSHQRVSNWLVAYGQDLVSGEDTIDVGGFFETLRTYVSTTKNLPPVVLSFFGSYLKVWNGRDSKKPILETLSHTSLPQDSFTDLYDHVFALLEARVLDGSVDSQLEILGCYTALLQSWIVILTSQDVDLVPDTVAIADLCTHVNRLCLTVLQTSSSTSTHSAVLDFYEQAAWIASNPILVQHTRIIIPPSCLVYALHFSSSPVTISRLCGVLARYKEGFQTAMMTSRFDYTVEYINRFNGFLMDICNCLWRSRAFNFKDANSHACLMPASIVTDLAAYAKGLNMSIDMAALFTLSASPALGMLATSFLRELEEMEMEQGTGDLDTRHAGPVTKASLVALAKKGGLDLSWDEYRQGVLGYLEQQGMDGVGQLMHNTMTTLMKRT
ncbi:Mis6-domain-containing protein [Xylariales sp. AK1849]|nr:Mis6-domain-containing protein [Xylariales sp. AK1849]